MDQLIGVSLCLAGYFAAFLGGWNASVCQSPGPKVFCFVGGIVIGIGLILLGSYHIAGK